MTLGPRYIPAFSFFSRRKNSVIRIALVGFYIVYVMTVYLRRKFDEDLEIQEPKETEDIREEGK